MHYQPIVTEEDGIGAKICYSKPNLFLVIPYLYLNYYEFLNLASGIVSTISIVHLEQVWEIMGLDPILGDEVLVNQRSSAT